MLKVWLKDLPWLSVPLSNSLFESAVTVCAVESLLVQVTVVPFLTVILAGEKLKLVMLTLFVTTEAWEFAPGELLGIVIEVLVLLLLCPMEILTTIAITAMTAIDSMACKNFFILNPPGKNLIIFKYSNYDMKINSD
jgi:hypothetical protein